MHLCYRLRGVVDTVVDQKPLALWQVCFSDAQVGVFEVRSYPCVTEAQLVHLHAGLFTSLAAAVVQPFRVLLTFTAAQTQVYTELK